MDKLPVVLQAVATDSVQFAGPLCFSIDYISSWECDSHALVVRKAIVQHFTHFVVRSSSLHIKAKHMH